MMPHVCAELDDWGVIQHYVGDRERLLLAVFEQRSSARSSRNLPRRARSTARRSKVVSNNSSTSSCSTTERRRSSPTCRSSSISGTTRTRPPRCTIVDDMSVATISDVGAPDPRHARAGMLCRSRDTIFIAFVASRSVSCSPRTQPHASLPVGHDDEMRRRRLLTHWLVASIDDRAREQAPTREVGRAGYEPVWLGQPSQV